MTIKQIAFIAGAVVLSAVIYLYGEIQPPPTKDSGKEEEAMSAANDQSGNATLREFARQRLSGLDSARRRPIDQREEALQQSAADEQEKLRLLRELDSVSRANDLTGLAAYYSWRIARERPSYETNLTAGRRLSRLADATSDTLQKEQFKKIAVESLRAAIQADSSATSPRIALANLYLQSRQEVMQGIQILLDVVDKYPEHPRANLILGRYGIISGQYDKAISRLEKVLGSDTLRAQAYFHLGEAYYGSGNKEEALKHLQKSKELMNNPALRDTIDRYIRNIQNI